MLFDFVCTDFDRVTLQGYNEIRAITLNGFEFIVIKVKREQVRSYINRIRMYIRDVPVTCCQGLFSIPPFENRIIELSFEM